ncbi:MAG TPA: hypothetical protein VK817_01640 [Trebonia sp.]|nr:hypothetical protein [Trebonia sp.]
MTEAASAPKERVLAECARRGRDALVAGCIALIEGRYDEVDDGLVVVLGGEHGRGVLDGYNGGKSGYWPRVWAARGLLHAWDDAATDAIITATADPAWRVREMAGKVAARHRVGTALAAVAALRADKVERVRAAAERAVVTLTAHGA